MAVYALYVPSARHTCLGIEMEKFPSIEHGMRILKWRNNTKRSKTYYVVERERPSDQERGYFQQANRTGYMRVFLRTAADPVPGLLDTPDEEWILERSRKSDQGRVVRLPWIEGDERASARGEFLRVDPSHLLPRRPAEEVTPDYEVRKPGTDGVKPAACPACRMAYSVTGRCLCS